jgi:hypothetical protein
MDEPLWFWLNLPLTLLDLSNRPLGPTELDQANFAREHAGMGILL